MELACRLNVLATKVEGVHQWPYKALASAIEVIPRTLAQNCGGDVVRMLTELRAKHSVEDGSGLYWGIDGNLGKIMNMEKFSKCLIFPMIEIPGLQRFPREL